MKSSYLTINQRIFAVTLYTGSFLVLCRYFSGDWSYLVNSDSDYNILFVSGALLLIFGTYIAEPFFTKPVDVITNSIAVILALLSIQEPSLFIGYWPVFYTSVALAVLSILVIFSSHFFSFEKAQQIFLKIVTEIGQSKVIFSIIYLLTIVSYFSNEPIAFVFFLTYWLLFITKRVVEYTVLRLSEISKFLFRGKTGPEVLGEAIGCENPFLYKVEVDYFKHKAKESRKGELVYLSLDGQQGAVGIIINEKHLLNKKWITVYLLENENSPLKINLKNYEFVTGSKTIFSKDNAVYSLNLEDVTDTDSKELVSENYLYKNKNNFIGYIAEGSDIQKIRFHSLLDSTSAKYKLLKEGTVIKTGIHGEGVLYQIIDGKTYEEELEKHSIYGYLTGIAQKLGRYNTGTQELEVVKWLPNMYSPVFFDDTESPQSNELAIGTLPETQLGITLKDADSLVTHNTAVLGILGIGKSCLTFELVKKAVENTNVKVVCIDITNEYKAELPQYLDSTLIQNEVPEKRLNDLKIGNKDGNADDPTSWGNEDLYRKQLDDELKEFSENETKRVLLLNPDWHSVSKAGSSFKITHKVDLTIAEKTRLISERVFLLAKKEWDSLAGNERKGNKAKYLLVFEEAHSLIPEWNSVANAGDQSASNGTAKVILQGRKYGLGSFVVTQRTANISKSILNQCNTIFALRVFDDTGKQFLENYIGSDYSNTLPTLEERHAIAVGKALKLKQPVIIKLNEKENIIRNPEPRENA